MKITLREEESGPETARVMEYEGTKQWRTGVLEKA